MAIHIRRREFMIMLGGAVLSRPLAVRAFGRGGSAHDKVALSKEETEAPP